MDEIKNIIKFEESVMRRVWHNDEWYFVIRDVVTVLTESKDPTGYLKDMRRRDKELGKGWWQIATPLSIETEGGKQKMSCANTKGIFRIIQSIRSPKAEPFKQWLAQVGYERIQENENPDLIIDRIRETYKLKGYTDEWIDTRLQSIGARKKLTDEWKKRDVKVGRQYAILTAELSQATFGIKPSKHKKMKGLKRQNLRDHMTEEELVFTMLGEIRTRNEANKMDAQGFSENKIAVKKAGKAANEALNAYEKATEERVLSKENFLKQIINKTKKKLKGK